MRLMLNGLLGLGLLLLTACVNVYEWNQKLTVVIETPDGPLSASTVTKVIKTDQDAFWMPIEARGVTSTLQGEAITLEVTDERYLFVLIEDMDQLAIRSFTQFTYSSGGFGRWARTIANHRGTTDVPAEHYPMMVTFDDIDDPTSVRLVTPDTFEAIFGTGLDFAGMTLSITEEQPTNGVVVNVLDWLPKVSPDRLDGDSIERSSAMNRLANSLSANSFTTERFDGDF